MKKTIFLFFALLGLSGCAKYFSDSEWSGTYDYGENAGRSYMLTVANNVIVDNLKQMEIALFIDANSSGTSGRFSSTGDVWTAGSVWTVIEEDTYLSGLKIVKEAEDSTWTLSRKGKYPFGYSYRYNYYDYYSGTRPSNYFDTEYKMEVRMLPDHSDYKPADHYPWRVKLTTFSRTEDKGYSSSLYTGANHLDYKGGTLGGWDQCHGVLFMEVYKDKKIIDKARLQLEGSQGSGSYIRNL
jgi:hypothetical protein